MKEDDGSLAFLNIPRNMESRSFNCDEITQSKLVNTQFWVVDFIEDVPNIEDELKLKVKGNWQIFPIAENRQDKNGRGLDYVGYVFFRKQRLIRKAIKQNLCRKAAKLNKKKINEKQYRMALAPWIGWAKHSNAKNLINKISRYEIIL